MKTLLFGTLIFSIANLKNSLLEKDIIDILPQNKIGLQDPVFELWLKKEIFKIA